MKGVKLGLPKLQDRDIALILIAIGFVMVALVYVFGYQKLTEETQSLESTNSTMRQQVTLLQRLTDNRAQYEAETAEYIDEAQEILDTFPVDLYEEDLILYALKLDTNEDENFIGSVASPRREAVGLAVPTREDELVSATDITGQIQANAYVNDGSVLDVSEAVLNVANGSMSLNTSYNGFKNLVIDLIGWVNGETEEGEYPDAIITEEAPPGAETPGTEGDSDTASPDGAASPDGTVSPDAEPVEATGVEAGTEEEVNKNKVVAQRRINRIDLSFDPETGEYVSMVDVSFFAMEGLGREYTKPDSGVQDHGLSNIFGNNLLNGTLLPPLSDLDPNYVPPQPGQSYAAPSAEGEGTGDGEGNAEGEGAGDETVAVSEAAGELDNSGAGVGTTPATTP